MPTPFLLKRVLVDTDTSTGSVQVIRILRSFLILVKGLPKSSRVYQDFESPRFFEKILFFALNPHLRPIGRDVKPAFLVCA